MLHRLFMKKYLRTIDLHASPRVSELLKKLGLELHPKYLPFSFSSAFLRASCSISFPFLSSFCFCFVFVFAFFVFVFVLFFRKTKSFKFLGKPLPWKLSEKELGAMVTTFGEDFQPNDVAEVYARFQKGVFVFTSRLYTRQKLRRNSTVAFKGPQGKLYGDIQFFFVREGVPYAIVSAFQLIQAPPPALSELALLQSFIQAFFPVTSLDALLAVPLSEVLGPCVTVRSGNLRHYVMSLANHHEIRF